MELRDYLKIIGKHLTVFVLIVIVATAVAFILTKIRSTTYTAATTFSAFKSSKVNPVEKYDPETKTCTNLQLANEYSVVVSDWFLSSAIVQEFYQEAGVAVPNISQDKLAKTFKAVYTPEGVIDVTLSGQNPDQLVKLLNAANSVLQAKTADFSDRDTYNYQLSEETPVVTLDKPSLVLNTLIGFITGLILAALTVMVVEYFRKNRK